MPLPESSGCCGGRNERMTSSNAPVLGCEPKSRRRRCLAAVESAAPYSCSPLPAAVFGAATAEVLAAVAAAEDVDVDATAAAAAAAPLKPDAAATSATAARAAAEKSALAAAASAPAGMLPPPPPRR
jgi:hypothetical protein